MRKVLLIVLASILIMLTVSEIVLAQTEDWKLIKKISLQGEKINGWTVKTWRIDDSGVCVILGCRYANGLIGAGMIFVGSDGSEVFYSEKKGNYLVYHKDGTGNDVGDPELMSKEKGRAYGKFFVLGLKRNGIIK